MMKEKGRDVKEEREEGKGVRSQESRRLAVRAKGRKRREQGSLTRLVAGKADTAVFDGFS